MQLRSKTDNALSERPLELVTKCAFVWYFMDYTDVAIDYDRDAIL